MKTKHLSLSLCLLILFLANIVLSQNAQNNFLMHNQKYTTTVYKPFIIKDDKNIENKEIRLVEVNLSCDESVEAAINAKNVEIIKDKLVTNIPKISNKIFSSISTTKIFRKSIETMLNGSEMLSDSILLATYSIEDVLYNYKSRTKSILDSLRITSNLEVCKRFIKEIDQIDSLSSIQINNLNSEIKKAEKTLKKKDIDENIATLPEIVGLDNFYKPNIELIGSKKIEKHGTHTIGIFIGNTVTDTASIRTIALPENSKYGTFLKGNFNFNKNNQADYFSFTGLNYSFMYTDKEFNGFGNQGKINYKLFQFEIGGELLIYKDFVSLYANYNHDRSLTNQETYRSFFQLPEPNQSFFDYGIKLFYSQTSKKYNGLGIFTDINFIHLNEDLKIFKNNSDKILPNIKIGLQKNL